MRTNDAGRAQPERVRILICQADAEAASADPALAGVAETAARLSGAELEYVGPRPGKQIDPLLETDRLVVVGQDGDLAAVALRLMRRELLQLVAVGYATGRRTPVTDLYSLPIGPPALRTAILGDPDLVSLVRNDVGGVLVGRGVLAPVQGTVYVDDHRVLQGVAASLVVVPEAARGLEVTVVPRRLLGVVSRRATTARGRAVQIGTAPSVVISDGVRHDRPMERWTFYKHTEPLRLARGLV